jgi:DNA-binding response OmpR family regulator
MNKILLIEDDIAISKVLEDILSKYAIIHTASNKKDAMTLISQQNYDLIMADYYLGEENGIDIVKTLQSHLGQVPVILTSAFPTVDMLSSGIDLKVVSFLKKPIDIQTLIDKVEALLLFDISYNFNGHKIMLKNSSFTLVFDNDEIQLTEIQFKLMKYFLDNADKVVEREKITSSIWGTTRLNSENTFDTHLLNLKKKFPLVRDHLRTLPRVGYILASEKKAV